jgi:hypothetical protein
MERQIPAVDMWYWATESSCRSSSCSRRDDFVCRNFCGHNRCEYCRVPGGGSFHLLEDRTDDIAEHAHPWKELL